MSNRAIYFVDTTGRVFRSLNIEAASAGVVYEDLGVVSAGLRFIALSEFDKENEAMVCGINGVWKTTDLSAAIPTWTNILTPPAGWVFDMVRSSPVQQDLWMVSGMKIGAAGSIGVWWSETGGAAWSSDLALRCGSWGTYASTYLELSSHDPGRAWVNWWLWNGLSSFSTHTDDLWATKSCDVLPTFTPNTTTATRVCSHHPEESNPDDLIAVWASGVARTNNRAFRCTADTGTCAGFVDLCVGTTLQGVRDLGALGALWWLLARCDGGVAKFFNSNDGSFWTEVHQFAGVVRHSAMWPDDGRRHVAAHDGAVFPLLFSMDRGDNWLSKAGNWAALGYTGNIRSVAVGVSSPIYDLTPIGGGLRPQAMDVDGDGSSLFLGLYDNAGNPLLLSVQLPLSAASVGSVRYAPGAGDAINIVCENRGDHLAISGFFGNNQQVRVSGDGFLTSSDVDPGTWGGDRAQPLTVGPEGIDDLAIALETAQEIHSTADRGVNWTRTQAAVGFPVAAMARKGRIELVVGDGGAGVHYSPNLGETLQNITGAFVGWLRALAIK